MNSGFGWVCTKCSETVKGKCSSGRARFFSEGEAEEKQPLLSTTALARWKDPQHKILCCPTCGLEEEIQNS